MPQAELARQLDISQGSLSLIERGSQSLSAEQFIVLLQLFNVPPSAFVSSPHDDAGKPLQNALARLGASHLHERADVVVDEADVHGVVRDALVSGDPRHVTALGPVLVRNVGLVNFARVSVELQKVGLERRLPWLLENVLVALETERSQALPRAVATLYRRTRLVIDLFVHSVAEALPRPDAPPDILDRSITTEKSVRDAEAHASEPSRRWRVVTTLQPDDFRAALESARGG